MSVQDAAIRALAEIGDKGVLSLLIKRWREREFAIPKAVTVAPWQNKQRRSASSATWVADAIERLSGMRPVRVAATADQFNLEIGGLSLTEVYAIALCNEHTSVVVDLPEAARKLLTVSEPRQIESLHSLVSVVKRVPNAQQLEVEIELIELLAEQGHAEEVLKSLFVRISRTGAAWKIETTDAASAAVRAYQTTAISIWNTLEPTQKTAMAVPLLFWLVSTPEVKDRLDWSPMKRWLSESENRSNLHLIMNRNRVVGTQAIVALIRANLEDDEMLLILKTQFEDELFSPQSSSLTPRQLLAYLVALLSGRPDLNDMILQMIENQLLDKTRPIEEEGSDKKEISARAELLSVLYSVPPTLRENYGPLLTRLAESGTHGEAEAATSVFRFWDEVQPDR